jgi:hypothetical protein
MKSKVFWIVTQHSSDSANLLEEHITFVFMVELKARIQQKQMAS